MKAHYFEAGKHYLNLKKFEEIQMILDKFPLFISISKSSLLFPNSLTLISTSAKLYPIDEYNFLIISISLTRKDLMKDLFSFS